MPVDIIIPFHNQYIKVRNLVESILLHIRSNPYLITLVDSGSDNPFFIESIKSIAPVRVVRLDENKGFGNAINQGIQSTKNNYIVCLHSDCLVKDRNWLQRLGETLLNLQKSKVQFVHSRTNNTSDTFENSEQSDNKDDKVVNNPLPFISALFHRDLFNKIGFVKEYPLAGYEGDEFFYRMKKKGYKQAISGKSWIFHHGGSTINEIIAKNNNAKIIMENNYDLCMKDIT